MCCIIKHVISILLLSIISYEMKRVGREFLGDNMVFWEHKFQLAIIWNSFRLSKVAKDWLGKRLELRLRVPKVRIWSLKSPDLEF